MTPRTLELELKTPAVDSSGRLLTVPLGVNRRPSESVGSPGTELEFAL